MIWSLYDGFIYGNNLNYFFAKLISLLAIIIFIPLAYYLYKFIFEKHNFIVNILIFYLSIIISQFLFRYILSLDAVSYLCRYISCVLLFIVFGSYLLLTLLPLEAEVFKDPISNKYGFNGHT